MPTLEEYLNLITSEYRQKPNFVATVTTLTEIPVRVQELMQSMIPLFDVDVAVGSQLDIIGVWVNISRNVNIPIENVYFTWDGDAALGWDFGIWQGNQTNGAVTVLPDDVYRTLIKAKIAANQWDGTTEGAYAIWSQVFTTIQILIKDNQDMTYELGFVGGTIDSLTLALILQGYIPLRPEGVLLAGIFIPSDSGPMFAWDVETDFLQGWDEGSWATFYPTP